MRRIRIGFFRVQKTFFCCTFITKQWLYYKLAALSLQFGCNRKKCVDADFSPRYNKSPKALWEIFFLKDWRNLNV